METNKKLAHLFQNQRKESIQLQDQNILQTSIPIPYSFMECTNLRKHKNLNYSSVSSAWQIIRKEHKKPKYTLKEKNVKSIASGQSNELFNVLSDVDEVSNNE